MCVGLWCCAALAVATTFASSAPAQTAPPPIGPPGRLAHYRNTSQSLPESVVSAFSFILGPTETRHGTACQWIELEGTKPGGQQFRVWLLSAGYPALSIKEARGRAFRYILQEGQAEPVEYRHLFTGDAVLPSVGGWRHLWPQDPYFNRLGQLTDGFPQECSYLGFHFRLTTTESTNTALPPPARVVDLLPDVLIGLPHNGRLQDETRRSDESTPLTRFTRADYRELAAAGFNCLRIDAEQLSWVTELNVFYWGLGGNALPYPECLYRSVYLGPELFLDEPAVGTRDYVIRPRLAKDAAFRKSLTPEIVFDAFKDFYHKAIQRAPFSFIHELAARSDVALGEMQFPQENLFSWETMVATAGYQLSQDPGVTEAMVFEPPGRVGAWRTVPELDMTYGCQLSPGDPKHLADVICGFLRGAARATGKQWGFSIYGAVDRADSYWLLTHAHDLGATRFFFWDTSGLAGVPYQESLALARNLRAHAGHYPARDLERLKRAAEVAILLPPGYNLGHVQLGKGSLWGLGELNLERTNRRGVKYRKVMANFFAEIERCLKLGVSFDLFWDLPGFPPADFREVVRVREDGRVEVTEQGVQTVLNDARQPPRPGGIPPELTIQLSARPKRAPATIRAVARVTERSAPVFYTVGADASGIYYNAVVAWELYGPGEEDYRFLMPPKMLPTVRRVSGGYEITTDVRFDRPGAYRLRAGTVDLAGRSTVIWTDILVPQ